MKKVLFVVAPENFRDEEFFEPHEVLETAGVECVVGSRETGVCRGVLGGEVEATLAIADADAHNFDGVIFVGGGGSQIFRDDRTAHQLANVAAHLGKVVAAICAAPTILARAGLLRGKKTTVFPDAEFEEILRTEGAQISEEANVVDGKIVTANGPAAARKFGEQILELL